MRSLKHPATIIAIVALIVSLTGSAYASGLINGSQIRNGTITGSKLATRTITGSRLANRTITLSQLSRTVLSALGPTQFVLVISNGHTILGGNTSDSTVACPPNTLGISGGYWAPGGIAVSDQPSLVNDGWEVEIQNPGASTITASLYAICAA